MQKCKAAGCFLVGEPVRSRRDSKQRLYLIEQRSSAKLCAHKVRIKSAEGRHSPHCVTGVCADNLHKSAENIPTADLTKDLRRCRSFPLISTYK